MKPGEHNLYVNCRNCTDETAKSTNNKSLLLSAVSLICIALAVDTFMAAGRLILAITTNQRIEIASLTTKMHLNFCNRVPNYTINQLG